MDNNSTSETSNIPKSSSTLAQPRKNPVFVTLQKIGTGFTFVRPSAATASQIPQRTKHISSTSLLTTNKVALANPGKTLRPQTPVSASPYDNNVQHYNTTIQQKKQQPINQIDTVIPTISITTKKALNRPNNSRKPSIAASSITIAKQKSIKKTSSKRQPKKLPTTKFNFPPPPPKIDFKVSTHTQFKTTVDEPHQGTAVEKPPVCATDINDVLGNCRLFTKLTIDTGTKQVVPTNPTAVSSVQVSPKANRRFSSDELREAIDNVDISSDAVNDQITEIGEIESGTDTHGYGEIIKRLDRVEALQLAAAKRDAQILVAVKKLCLAYTKYNDDNDEIKKMLPMKSQPQFDEMEIRLTAEPTLVEKFRAYLRGFKTSNNPVNFTSMLSVLMSDELVDSYNYKGILNKAKLEGTKIVDIIHDLHKPMDIKTFAKLMRETIDLAKNRHHNEQYRKRQMKLAQQMDL